MLTLLHTSPVHVATFDALRDRIAPGVDLQHVVRTDLLDRARTQGVTDQIAMETTQLIDAANGPVLCTCTTLGAAAEGAGAIRIDRPLMQAAAALGGPVMMVYCLESTSRISLALLTEEMARSGNNSTITPCFVQNAWPLFEAGDFDGFLGKIAAEIRTQKPAKAACVVLAQASMAGAVDLLSDLDVPVMASPELALRAGLGIA